MKGGFDITYADGTGSMGDYISDNFVISGATVKSLEMGLAFNTSVGVGIMGIGYDTNEATRRVYPNLIDQLVSQSLINTKAYSLYLDDLEASTGSIIFGGIDTGKYTGSLIGLPIQKDAESGTYSSFTVAMTSLSTVDSSGTATALTNSTFVQPVILDSGTTLTYLPDDLVASIVKKLGGVDDSQNSGAILVDCNLLSTMSGTVFRYGFGGSSGPVINVPISELIFEIQTEEGGFQSLPFQDTCALGIMGGGDTTLLGDTFLRSAYVVYDISNNQIAMAQTNFNSTSTNVVEIPADATIPNVSGVASQVTTSQTATAIPAVGKSSAVSAATGVATVTVTASAPTTSTSKAAAAAILNEFESGRLRSLCLAGLLAVLGGSWFLA